MKIEYYEHSNTEGALLNFMFKNDRDEVDFSKSTLLTLEKNMFPNRTLPKKELHHGLHTVYVYDIEYDGTLPNGVQYPAVVTEVLIENPSKQHACR